MGRTEELARLGIDPNFPIAVVFGGGSGPLPLEDELLDRTPNVFSVTGVHDNGGHSRIIRDVLGISAPGDITHRFAVHIRNKLFRKIFDYRHSLNGNHHMNGTRPSNDLFAAACKITGSAIEAVKLLEGEFKNYKGRVLPLTDDIHHIIAVLADGTEIKGEDLIDTRPDPEPEIVGLKYDPDPITVNPEIFDYLSVADLIIIASSSPWTSTLPLLRAPGMAKAIQDSPGQLHWVCNAVNTVSECFGYTAQQHAQLIYDAVGRRIDYGYINKLTHQIPETYTNKRSFAVEVDPNLKQLEDFINNVLFEPFTYLYETVLERNGEKKDIKMVRHYGTLMVQRILAHLPSRLVTANGNGYHSDISELVTVRS